MAKQVGCYLVGAAVVVIFVHQNGGDRFENKASREKAELRRGERQIPKDG